MKILLNPKGCILSDIKGALIFTVLVAALGYFVDMYDLVLFGIVRVQSLKSLGFAGQSLIDYGVLLLNTQMAGMLIGGIIWGILGDKKGRLYVLFGSILLYSVANIANADYLRKGFAEMGFNTIQGETAILPVIVGDKQLAFITWRKLFDKGVFVNAFIPPGVPPNMSMIHTSVFSAHKQEHLDYILEKFGEVGKELGLIS